jgi:hypothetical protein
MKAVVRDCAITACQKNHLNCVVAGVSWKAAIAKKNLLFRVVFWDILPCKIHFTYPRRQL